MKISETTKIETIPDENQAYMPHYALSALKQTRLSKGLVAYEAIMLANEEYEDSLQKIRVQLMDELEDILTPLSVRDVLKKIILAKSEDAREQLLYECEYRDEEARAKYPTTLYLPLMLTKQFNFQRGLGKLVEESLVFVEACPWSSRIELVHDLADMLVLARGRDPVEPSEFVQDVMTGRSSTYYDESLRPLTDALMGDSPAQPLDCDGVRIEQPSVTEVEDQTGDGELAGYPELFREYKWDAASPDAELEFDEVKKILDSGVKDSYKYRAPLLYGFMNNMGRETGKATSSTLSNTAPLLFDDKAPSTIDRYIECTLELMRASNDWREGLILQAFNDGVEMPDELVVTEQDDKMNEQVVELRTSGNTGGDGRMWFDMFEYAPKRQVLWGMELERVERLRMGHVQKTERYRELIEETEYVGSPNSDIANAEYHEEQGALFRGLRDWMVERIDAQE